MYILSIYQNIINQLINTIFSWATLMLALEIGYGALTVTIVYICYKNWRNDRNYIDLALLLVMLFSGAESIYNILIRINGFYVGNQNLITIGGLDFDSLLKLCAGAVYLWFVFYLLELRPFYTYSFVSVFYLVIYAYFTGDNDLIIWTTGIWIGIVWFVFLYFMYKNKDGRLLALCIAIALYVINDIIGNEYLVYYILQYFASIILYMGLNRTLDEVLFYDKEYLNNISNTWISTRILTKSKKKKLQRKKNVKKIRCQDEIDEFIKNNKN